MTVSDLIIQMVGDGFVFFVPQACENPRCGFLEYGFQHVFGGKLYFYVHVRRSTI